MCELVFCRAGIARPEPRELQSRLSGIGLHLDLVVEDEFGCVLYGCKSKKNDPAYIVFDNGDYIFCTGMFSYGSEWGRSALKAYFHDLRTESLTQCGTVGQFVILARKNGKVWLSNDPLGSNKIYHNSDRTVFSNLFIAVAESVDHPSIDLQGCYEYAWNGVSFGDRTILREVSVLPAEHAAVIDTSVRTEALPAFDYGETERTSGSVDAMIELHIQRLRGLIRHYTRAYGDRIHLSFSGGYDSRLLLALFLDAGVKPRIFVYGREWEKECAIARSIADQESLAFELVDKSAWPAIPVEDYPQHLARNYVLFDGWKNNGLLDTGADATDRAERVRDGLVKVNGSAGEIYRNFFYLPDRRYTTREVVWSFYSQYTPSACTERFEPSTYEANVADAIRHAVGARGEPLERRQVELIYPLFRVRYWTARDVPINQGFGPCLFPFMEPAVIKGTADIPIALKSYGLFEARMIRRLSARLAAQPSIYGHSFAEDPPLSYKVKILVTQLRPPVIRRITYRVKHRRRQTRPYYLQANYLERVLDLSFPYMGAYFHVAAVNDADVFNRIATMEYVCRRLGARRP